MWMNPPYRDWDDVIEKIKKDRAHAVLILPQWPVRPWSKVAKAMQVRMVFIPKRTYLFQLRGKACRPTHWPVEAMLVCGHPTKCSIPMEQTAAANQVSAEPIHWTKASKRR